MTDQQSHKVEQWERDSLRGLENVRERKRTTGEREAEKDCYLRS